MIILLICLLIPSSFFKNTFTSDEKLLSDFEYAKIERLSKQEFKEDKKNLEAVYKFNYVYQYNDKNHKTIKNSLFLVDEYPTKPYYKYLFAPMAYQSKLTLHTDFGSSVLFNSNTNLIQLDMHYDQSKSHDYWILGAENTSKTYKDSDVKLMDTQVFLGKKTFFNHKWNWLLQGSVGMKNDIFPKYSVYNEFNYLNYNVNYSIGYKYNTYSNNYKTHIGSIGLDWYNQSWAFYLREYFNINENQELLYVTKFQVEYFYDYKKSAKLSLLGGTETLDTTINSQFKEVGLDLTYKVDPRVTIKPGVSFHSNDLYNEVKIGVDFTWMY